MSYKLTDTDYKNILEFYEKPVPKSRRLLKKQAEDMMALKLCACIKKIGPSLEPRSIGICTRSVINTKGIKRGSFQCKKKRKIQLSKTSRKGVSVGNKKTRKMR